MYPILIKTGSLLLLIYIALVFTVRPALACPFCHTETGQAVNQQIFGDDFVFNLIVTLLPFAIISILIALFHLSGAPILKIPKDLKGHNRSRHTYKGSI